MRRMVSRLLPRSALVLGVALLAALSWVGCADQGSDLTAPSQLGAPSAQSSPQLALSVPVPQDVFEAAIAAQERKTHHLLSMPGVVGTAVGLNANGRPAVKVYVETGQVAGVPRTIDGIPVSIEVTGKFFALQDARGRQDARKKCASPPCKPGGGGGGGGGDPPVDPTARFDRPVPIGVSTGHPAITAGTIGARVTDGTNVYALSNNHVYANQNDASIGDATKPGDTVIQPGTFDGGSSPADDIGTLAAFKPIVFSTSASNVIDAAIALSSTGALGNATPSDGYGTPKSATTSARIRMRVKKYGRTTGQTKGRVTGLNAIVNVNYGNGRTARFMDQIVIGGGGFSAGGDSGSLIVVDAKGADDLKPVGLLFAGGGGSTIANPIGPVLDILGQELGNNINLTIDGG